jgi:hypothetical protein
LVSLLPGPKLFGETTERHVNILTKSAESRLADLLIRLATSAGKVGNSGLEIDIAQEQSVPSLP